MTSRNLVTSFKVSCCAAGWRDWFFLTLETSSGVTGSAEFTESNGPKQGILTTVHEVAQKVIGSDPRDLENIVSALRRQFRQSLGGTTWKAIASVENALWDLRSKIENVTIDQIVDSSHKRNIESVSVYWSHCGTTRIRAAKAVSRPAVRTLADLQALGDEVVAEGFVAFKTNIFDFSDIAKLLMPGFSPETNSPALVGMDQLSFIEKTLESLTRNGEHPVKPIVDLNYNLNPSCYGDLIASVKRFKPNWIEIDFASSIDLHHLPLNKEVRICTGENLLGLDAYEPYLRSEKIDIISIDLLWNGLSESIAIAQRAIALGKKVTIHNYYSHFATSMALIFLDLLPETELLEFDNDDVPWRDDIVVTKYKVNCGQISHQPSLGWGNQINDDLIDSISSPSVARHRALLKFLSGLV